MPGLVWLITPRPGSEEGLASHHPFGPPGGIKPPFTLPRPRSPGFR